MKMGVAGMSVEVGRGGGSTLGTHAPKIKLPHSTHPHTAFIGLGLPVKQDMNWLGIKLFAGDIRFSPFGTYRDLETD